MSSSGLEPVKTSDNGEVSEHPPIIIPEPTGHFKVDSGVIEAFPEKGTKVIRAQNYGESLWGRTAKIRVELPSERRLDYFLKVIDLGLTGRQMCEGEYESLKQIYSFTPSFVPQPLGWGRFKDNEAEIYFLLAEFRDIGEQAYLFVITYQFQKPAEPAELAAALADLHMKSKSPTGKFGFHITTCHAKIPQAVDVWEDSWCALFSRHLGRTIDLARPIIKRADFDVLSSLTLEKVVPRLLLPLQAEGRVLKPCLVHGDCWDGNTAMDANTGEAFIFDVCSFYGHNEYDTGNWRAPRHRLSNRAYINAYKRHYPVSPPEADWDSRNLLYSLTFNIGNTVYIAGSNQKEVVINDMRTLCNRFCPEDVPFEFKRIKSNMIQSPHLSQEHFEFDDEEEENQSSDDEGIASSPQCGGKI